MTYYWELIQHDGTRIEIPPELVDVVKRRMTDNLPINTKTMSIPAHQIKTFRITEKPYGTSFLLEEVAHAFNEQIENSDGSMVSRWVKKGVTQDKWNRYYSPNVAYKKLGEEGAMVIVAFFLPIHLIDANLVQYCTDEEVNKINRKY